MKAHVYKLRVEIDYMHAYSKVIVEMHVPELGLHCNEECCFVDYNFADLPRPPVETTPKEIELTEEEVCCLQQLANALRTQKAAEKTIHGILNRNKANLPDALAKPQAIKMRENDEPLMPVYSLYADHADGKP
jgi:hypothetical protein